MQISIKPKEAEETKLQNSSSLESFLEQKPLFYKEIDYDRFPRIFSKIKDNFTCKNIIHLVGTNGKGTTGRFLANALYKAGYKTGHYTSPHIIRFNERIWLDGSEVEDEILERSHQKLLGYLSKEDADALSYFEYTTLLAMVIYQDCEYIVLEAGLGGEYDATAVFDSILTIATIIDFDHEAFLGSNIQEIAATKLRVTKKALLLAKQKHQEVYTVTKEVTQEKQIPLYLAKEVDSFIRETAKELSLAQYLEQNLATAVTALEILHVNYTKESFKDAKLFGRMTKLKENVVIDVGHNPLAATSLVEVFKDQKKILVYNTFEDKDYKKILQILKPIILHVEILQIEDQRIEKKERLQNVLNELEIEYQDFKNISKDHEYLVFGSFRVVEEFLKRYA